MTVRSRLRVLETQRQSRANEHQITRLFDPSDFAECTLHHGCDIEVATEEHHRGVIHLAWTFPWETK